MNVAFCFALLLGLAVVTQGRTEEYYIYQTPNGELVISNKEPPPGSKIIKQLPGVTDRDPTYEEGKQTLFKVSQLDNASNWWLGALIVARQSVSALRFG